jgi:hypothetical protein
VKSGRGGLMLDHGIFQPFCVMKGCTDLLISFRHPQALQIYALFLSAFRKRLLHMNMF